jgi:hypothetical protein
MEYESALSVAIANVISRFEKTGRVSALLIDELRKHSAALKPAPMSNAMLGVPDGAIGGGTPPQEPTINAAPSSAFGDSSGGKSPVAGQAPSGAAPSTLSERADSINPGFHCRARNIGCHVQCGECAKEQE